MHIDLTKNQAKPLYFMCDVLKTCSTFTTTGIDLAIKTAAAVATSRRLNVHFDDLSFSRLLQQTQHYLTIKLQDKL